MHSLSPRPCQTSPKHRLARDPPFIIKAGRRQFLLRKDNHSLKLSEVGTERFPLLPLHSLSPVLSPTPPRRLCCLPLLPALPFFPPHPMTLHILPLASSLGQIQWPEATKTPLTPTTGPTTASSAGCRSSFSSA